MFDTLSIVFKKLNKFTMHQFDYSKSPEKKEEEKLRQQIAIAAMQGMLSGNSHYSSSKQELVTGSVAIADLMIKELKK